MWGGDIRVVKSSHRSGKMSVEGHDEAGRILRPVTVGVVSGGAKYCW